MDKLDLDAAAKAGLISEDQALKLRNFQAVAHGQSAADLERFGTADGLSDIMAAAGLFMAIGALLAFAISASLVFALPVAALCWFLAGIFTLRRRLTLTSFVLFMWYTIAIAVAGFCVALALTGEGLFHTPAGLRFWTAQQLSPAVSIITGLLCMVASALYWRRFHLPIAYASIFVPAIQVLTQLARLLLPDADGWVANLAMLMGGLLLFAVAMAWDISDIRRETRRADVAFWLHAFAGFQLSRAMFSMALDAGSGGRGWDRLLDGGVMPPDSGTAMLIIAIAAGFTIVALIIDRRSLLVSSLAYVLPATALLAGSSGYLAPAVAAFAVGLALVLTSLFWRQLRRPLVEALPVAVQAQLPRTGLVFETPRPVA